MSVIAAKVLSKSIEIGADSLITYADNTKIQCDNGKLFRNGSLVVGCAGDAAEATMMKLFMEKNKPSAGTQLGVTQFMTRFERFVCDQVNQPQFKSDNEFLIVYGGKLFQYYKQFSYEVTTFAAVGSGGDFSLGAFAQGASVSEAIEIACRFSVYCAPPFTKYSIPRKATKPT